MKGFDTDLDGFLIFCEKADHLTGDQEGKQGTNSHDTCCQGKGSTENLLNPFLFPGTVIKADQWTDALDDTVSRQVNKGLQLVIGAEHQDIGSRESRQDAVQGRDQEGRQGHIQGSRDTNGIQLLQQCSVPYNIFPCKGNRQRPENAEHNINKQCDELADSGSIGSTCHSHLGERTDPEDHQRIQYNIGDKAAHHTDHGYLHASNSLKYLFQRNAKHDDDGEQEGTVRIGQSHGKDLFIVSKQRQEFWHAKKTDDH